MRAQATASTETAASARGTTLTRLRECPAFDSAVIVYDNGARALHRKPTQLASAIISRGQMQ